MSEILQQLDATLVARRDADPEVSYVAGLYRAGINKILEKVGEESTEVILAAKDCAAGSDRQAVINETADLWFHCLIMLSQLGASSDDVLSELQRRFGLSGLEEKAARQESND